MMEVAQNPLGSTTRVVYVDLDDEIDGEEDDLEFGVWLPRNGEIPVFCSSHCHEVSNKAFDQTEKISRTFCSQRGAEIVTHVPICNADAVDEITQKWPNREPYALARPSESGDISRSRRRRYKERSNYAKALLRSDTELEKLSSKIRLEIQQSEMLDLALQAERAADAGFLSFSARPSTYGLDPLQDGYHRNLQQPSAFSQQTNQTFRLVRTPSETRLKPSDLRNVTEVIPQWKYLHSHIRTHLFRRKVHEATLVFSEKESSCSSTDWKANFETSASNIARQSFKFLGDFADSTVRKLRSQPGIPTRAIWEPTQVEKVTKGAHIAESSLFGPALASHLSPVSHGDKFWRHHLSVPHGLLHTDEASAVEISSTTPNFGSSLEVPFLRGTLSKRGKEKSDRYCHDTRFAEMEIQFSKSRSRLETNDRTNVSKSTKYPKKSRIEGIVHSSVTDTDEDNLPSSKSVVIDDFGRIDRHLQLVCHPKKQGQEENAHLRYETPVGLRDIRGQSEWKISSDNSFFSPILDDLESNDIAVLTLSEALDNHSLDATLCKSSDEEEKKDCGLSSNDEQHESQRESSLLNYPIALTQTCQGDDHLNLKESIDELSVLTPREPVSLDAEDQAESPSDCASKEEDLLLYATTWEGDLSESSRVLRNTHSWPLQGLVAPVFPLDTGKALRGQVNEPRSSISDPVPLPPETSDVTSSSDGNGICHTFPSADENFQSAVEEMFSRLSTNTTTWRRDVFIGERDNDEFLNNYFYCTKLRGKSPTPVSSHTKERFSVGIDSLCHVLGGDAVCSGFRFIFSEQVHRPAVTTSRQRSVSLDGRWHEKAPTSSSWYATLEGMLNHFGSSRESSCEVDPLHFDPPHLSKASFAKY